MSRLNPDRLVTGVAEIDAKLRELKLGMANRLIRKGQTAACKVLKQAMRSAAPNKLTKQSIAFKVGLNRGKHRASVGMDVGKKKRGAAKWQGKKIPESQYIHPLAHLFVLGTKQRSYKTKTGASHRTGQMQPRTSFVRAATNSAKDAALQAQTAVIQEEIKKEWDKR